MRASPAFQISLQRFGQWQAAVGALALLGMLALAIWWLQYESTHVGAVASGLCMTAAVVLALAYSLARVPALRLRWDGQAWHLAPASASDDAAVPGELAVMLDFGAWLLVRFTPLTASQRPVVSWLPIQRRGVEAQWHALRCALHAPRTAPRDAASIEF